MRGTVTAADLAAKKVNNAVVRQVVQQYCFCQESSFKKMKQNSDMPQTGADIQ